MTVQPGGVRTEMAAHSGEISLSRAAELSDHHRDPYAELIEPSLSSQASFLREGHACGQSRGEDRQDRDGQPPEGPRTRRGDSHSTRARPAGSCA